MKYPSFGLRIDPLLIGVVVLALASGNLSRPAIVTAAPAQTVTVTTTPVGTLQTQLSTNDVWAGLVGSAPGGPAKLAALNAPLIRLHVGDDGEAPALPEIRASQWANVGEGRPFQNLDALVGDVFAAGQQPLMNVKFAPDFMWSCYPNSVGVSANQTQGSGAVVDLTFLQYAQYMARIVSYYNKGTMTTEAGAVVANPAGTSHRITWWELWNEPDLGNETPCAPPSGQALTYQQYAMMWNAVTAAMLAVDPGLKFVGPATAGPSSGRRRRPATSTSTP